MAAQPDIQRNRSPQEEARYGRVGGALTWSVLGKALRGMVLAYNSVLVVRDLGAQSYGHYSLARTAVSFLTVICWMGLTQALLRYLPEMRVEGNASGARRLVALTLAVQAGLWSLLFLGTVVFRDLVERTWGGPMGELLILATGLMLVDLFVTTWTQVLTSWYEVRDLSVAQVVGSVLYLGLAVYALRSGLGPAGVLWASGLSSMAVGVYLALDSRRFLELEHGGGKPMEMGRVLQYAMPFAAISVLNLIVWRSSETLILGRFCTAQQVGFFDRAYNIPQQFLDFVPAAIWPLMLASFSEAYARDRRSLPRAVEAYYRLLYFLAAPISVWGLLVATRAVPGVYGPEWAPAGPVCAAFFGLFALTYIATPLSMCLYVMEKTWINLLVNFGSAVFLVTGNLVLIPRIGLWGAVIPVGAVIVITPFIYHAVVRRQLPEVRIPWAFIGRCYLAAAPLLVLGMWSFKITGLRSAAAISALAGLVSLVSIRFFRVLGPEDRQLLEKLRLPLRNLWLKLLFRGEPA